MESSSLRRKDTTKGRPLRILSLGRSSRDFAQCVFLVLVANNYLQMAGAFVAIPC